AASRAPGAPRGRGHLQVGQGRSGADVLLFGRPFLPERERHFLGARVSRLGLRQRGKEPLRARFRLWLRPFFLRAACSFFLFSPRLPSLRLRRAAVGARIGTRVGRIRAACRVGSGRALFRRSDGRHSESLRLGIGD
ncbi:MAG: hypothetical protein BRD37_06385, partial [Bacteroidetes bacterium QH_8_67_23]